MSMQTCAPRTFSVSPYGLRTMQPHANLITTLHCATTSYTGENIVLGAGWNGNDAVGNDFSFAVQRI